MTVGRKERARGGNMNIAHLRSVLHSTLLQSSHETDPNEGSVTSALSFFFANINMISHNVKRLNRWSNSAQLDLHLHTIGVGMFLPSLFGWVKENIINSQSRLVGSQLTTVKVLFDPPDHSGHLWREPFLALYKSLLQWLRRIYSLLVSDDVLLTKWAYLTCWEWERVTQVMV